MSEQFRMWFNGVLAVALFLFVVWFAAVSRDAEWNKSTHRRESEALEKFISEHCVLVEIRPQWFHKDNRYECDDGKMIWN